MLFPILIDLQLPHIVDPVFHRQRRQGMQPHPLSGLVCIGSQVIQPLAEFFCQGHELPIGQGDKPTGGFGQQLHQLLHIQHQLVIQAQFTLGGEPVGVPFDVELKVLEVGAVADSHFFAFRPFNRDLIP